MFPAKEVEGLYELLKNIGIETENNRYEKETEALENKEMKNICLG